GMAAGAGMVSLAVLLTAMHLLALLALGPLVRRIPTRDHRRVLRLTYLDGAGVLRDVLALATELGFGATVLASRRRLREGAAVIDLDVRFTGRTSLRQLVPSLSAVEGVCAVRVRRDVENDDEE